MQAAIDRLVAYYCGPTLMGIKAGNLFSLKHTAYTAQADGLHAALGILKGRGLHTHVFHSPSKTALIYLYRKKLLEDHLAHPLSRSLLHTYGYRGEAAEELVAELGRRIEKSDTFPHEIGLFLGYPPEDVAGFVKHKGLDCKLCGCWKVYGDVGRAKALFGQYAFCRRACVSCITKGMTLDQMVPVG